MKEKCHAHRVGQLGPLDAKNCTHLCVLEVHPETTMHRCSCYPLPGSEWFSPDQDWKKTRWPEGAEI